MSLRSDAFDFADGVLANAADEIGGIVQEAIEYRRNTPHRFALFHARMVELLTTARRPNGKHLIAWRYRVARHRFWARRYEAKSWAFDRTLAARCGLPLREGTA
jgi:hypothetical protein